MDLPKVLADLRAAGVTRARYVEGQESIECEFGPAARVGTPLGFVDKDGKPVNLDEGAGPLQIDPLDLDEPGEPDDLLSKNFPKKAARAAG